MRASLKDILRQSQSIEEKIVEAGGELDEGVELEWLNVNLELADKVDATQFIIERLAKAAEYWNDKANEYRRIARSLENTRHRIRDHVKAVMLEAGRQDLWGDDQRFKLSANCEKLVIEAERIPAEYRRQVVQSVPDEEKIRAALERGEKIPGARLETVYTLRNYPNKKAA